MGKQQKTRHTGKPKRRYYKKTSAGILLQLPEGYYGRISHVPAHGANWAEILECHKLGLYTFPLAHGSKKPLYGSHSFKEARKSHLMPARWLQGYDEETLYFDHNFAIATGKISNITVLDSDGGIGENSITLIEEILDQKFPKTITVLTPNNGKHRWYRYIPEFESDDNYLPKLDIKNNGGYVVAPSSVYIQEVKHLFKKHTGEFISNINNLPAQDRINIETHTNYHYIGEYHYAPGLSPADTNIASLPPLLMKTIFFCRRYGADCQSLLKKPLQERIRIIENWYEEFSRLPQLPKSTRSAGIRPKKDKETAELLDKLCTIDLTPPRITETLKSALKKLTSYIPDSHPEHPQFALPHHLLNLKKPDNNPSQTYKQSPSGMTEGDGRNSHMTSLAGFLWWHLESNLQYTPILWHWIQICNHAYREPLSTPELTKIYNSIIKYKQYKKSGTKNQHTPKTRPPRPQNNITPADQESKIIHVGIQTAIQSGIIEKTQTIDVWANGRHLTESEINTIDTINYITYPELYNHILLPILQQQSPHLQYTDITLSQKKKFIAALRQQLELPPAVYLYKGHTRIGIQFGYTLNITLPTIHPDGSIGIIIHPIRKNTHTNKRDTNPITPIPTNNTNIITNHNANPAEILSPQEYHRLLITNKRIGKEITRRKRYKTAVNLKCYHASSVRPRLIGIEDWQQEAGRRYRAYMEWRFGLIT
jgi:hypothetical protein